MRKLVYMIATTADGFIADNDGTFDFFPMDGAHMPYLFGEYPETFPGHLRATLGITSGNRHFDTVIMGRHTYEVGALLGLTNPYPQLAQYVVSSSLHAADPAVHVISKDPVATVRELKRDAGLDIWLCGGGVLADALFSEIDEVILKINPVLLGTGRPLLGGRVGPVALGRLESQSFDGGVTMNRYRVVRNSTPRGSEGGRGSGRSPTVA